jgi:hypothetical protein
MNPMTEATRPALSVVIVSYSPAPSLHLCLTALDGQRHRLGIEVLVIRGEPLPDEVEEALAARFPDVRMIAAPAKSTVPWMRAMGILDSRGEVVALLEDDCIPDPGWLSALAAAHAGPEAAVGGCIAPGRYGRALDWAVYFTEYGRFMPPLTPGRAGALPGTNVAYKRSALGSLAEAWQRSSADVRGSGLYEAFLHQELLRTGAGLKADPRLLVTNVSSWETSRALRSRFHHGRGFAGLRVAAGPPGRRLLFLLGTPALPFLQLARIGWRVARGRTYLKQFLFALPWIFLNSLAWSVGEGAGYLLGPGSSLRQWR